MNCTIFTIAMILQNGTRERPECGIFQNPAHTSEVNVTFHPQASYWSKAFEVT